LDRPHEKQSFGFRLIFRNRGRGVEHFWQEGAKVENHDGLADPYSDEAFRIRKEAKAAQKEQKKISRKTK
jgi:hypothetical protein